MNDVKLLNRVDTKFICSIFKLESVLKELSNLYDVLEIDKQRIMHYRTKYYDTYDFKMFNQHQNGKLNRYKVREREYVNSDLNFLEVKFKNNKRRTLKSRIEKVANLRSFNNHELDFLNSKLPFSIDQLEIKLYNSFERITLCNKSERVTIDFNLKLENDNEDTGIFPFLSIIEVKQPKYTINSDVVKVLKKHHIRACSFSKYCVGASLLYPNLKSNRIKSKLLLINKLSA